MPWDDYLALDPDVSGEYFEGCLVMAPSPDEEHQTVCWNVKFVLKQVVPAGYRVNESWQWSPRPGLNWVPDVMVYSLPTDPTRLTHTPVLAVEVLSQDRNTDLNVKWKAYGSVR